jgi:hypothetical protein
MKGYRLGVREATANYVIVWADDSPRARPSRSAPRIVGGCLMIAQGMGLVAAVLIAYWALVHVNASVTDAVRHTPRYADQATNVRNEITSYQHDQIFVGAAMAPLFVAMGIWLVCRRAAGILAPCLAAGALVLVSGVACALNIYANIVTLSGNEPLLDHVADAWPLGTVTDLVALSWIVMPVTALIAGALICIPTSET